MPTFYRIVKSDPPTEADFLSHRARGIPLQRDTPELRRSWEGVSVYASLEAARDHAPVSAPRPVHRREVIPEGGPISYEKSGDDPDHCDLFGDATDLRRAVVRIIRPD